MFKVRLFEREETPRKTHYIRLAIYFAIAALAVGLDQLTKWLVVQNMELKESIPLWEGISAYRPKMSLFPLIRQWFYLLP